MKEAGTNINCRNIEIPTNKRHKAVGNWDSTTLLFSAVNAKLTRNLRSYFDRWRDNVDLSGLIYTDCVLKPTWKLNSSVSPVNPKFKSASCVCPHITKEFFSK